MLVCRSDSDILSLPIPKHQRGSVNPPPETLPDLILLGCVAEAAGPEFHAAIAAQAIGRNRLTQSHLAKSPVFRVPEDRFERRPE